MSNKQCGYISILITFAIVVLIFFGGLLFLSQKDIESIENIPAPEIGSDAYYRQNPEEAEKRALEIQTEVEGLNTNIEDFYRETEGIDINTGEYVGFPDEE